MAKEASIEDLSYEEAYKELETTVAKLEGELSNLEKALALFERGQKLATYCKMLLENAELTVQKLTDDGNLEDID